MLSTFIIWLPFLLNWDSIGHLRFERPLSMLNIYRHWDGPLYILIAKTFYNAREGLLMTSPLGLPANYFPAHFPLYPFLISLGAPLLGYLKSMLVWPVLFAALYASALYFVTEKLKLSRSPLILALVALFFTPRLFIVRSVGGTETMFMFFVLVSAYFFLERRYLPAAILGAFAAFTRSPGILLFFAYGAYFLETWVKKRKLELSWGWILLIPTATLAVFALYYYQTGDFLAYFHSGDNIHLLFPPFQVFDSGASWVATGWLEDVYFLFLFYLLVLFTMYSVPKLRPAFYLVLAFFLAIVSVQHRDIARYSLAMLPFGLIAFDRLFSSRKFLAAMIILLPALYFYTWNFLMTNMAPITEWRPFQ